MIEELSKAFANLIKTNYVTELLATTMGCGCFQHSTKARGGNKVASLLGRGLMLTLHGIQWAKLQRYPQGL